MPRGPAPLALTIPDDVRPESEALAHSATAAHALVERARIVLGCAQGKTAPAVAEEAGCVDRTVRKWKSRFRRSPTVDALDDLPRSGRRARVSLATRCAVVELACRRPDEKLTPFRDTWTRRALAVATLAVTGVLLSVSEIGRILRFNHLRPHLVRYWLNCRRDPNFGEKAKRICDLYTNPPPGATVCCVDEKPIQVLGRKFPAWVGHDAVVHKEYEYLRRGTCCLIAAFEVGTGKVIGEVVAHRTAEATVAFLDKLATSRPTGDIYIVWDNLNTHCDGPERRRTRLNERQGHRFHFVHTPVHASWLNQVEIWFSIPERRVLRHGDFPDVAAAARRVTRYIDYRTANLAHPFRRTWRYRKSEDRHSRAA